MMQPGPAADLRSDRLSLRAPRRDDAEVIRALADDAEVARWMTRIPHPYRLEDAHLFLDEIVPHEVVWVIEAMDATLVGIGGFAFRDGSEVELGYWLGQAFWGHGFATEAARLMLGHAWACGHTCVRSGCFDGNARSRHVLEKVGFRVTGRSTRLSLAQGLALPHLDMLAKRPTGWSAFAFGEFTPVEMDEQ